MATQSNPRPDDIPVRPRLTAGIVLNLRTSDGSARADSAKEWLAAMRKWAAWAIEYCNRLDAVYVEHQAIAHDHRVEPGALADTVGLRCVASLENCKVCAYLYEQYEANQL